MQTIWLSTVALAFVAACSGGGDTVDLTGRWQTPASRDELEFLPGDRFVITVETPEGVVTQQGTYTARDGVMTLFYDQEPTVEGALVRASGPFWTDGDTLETVFYSPDHDTDAIVGTWRWENSVDIAYADGTIQTTETEYVAELAADGTVVEETFRNGVSERAREGTYTVSDDEVTILWSGGFTEVFTVRDRRMASLVYVRSE